MRIRWTETNLLRLKDLYTKGVPIDEIAAAFGATQYAVSTAIHQRLRVLFDIPRRSQGSKKGCKRKDPETHYNLFEPWAEYTARKKAERAAAKTSLSAVTLTGQDSD